MKRRSRIVRYMIWVATLPVFCHDMGIVGCGQHVSNFASTFDANHGGLCDNIAVE